MLEGFTGVDYVFLAILLFSILGGILKGGIREIAALLTWIAAFIGAGFFASPLAKLFSSSEVTQSWMSSAAANMNSASTVTFAVGVSFILIFISIMIIGSLLGKIITRAIENDGISIVNRFAGALLGFGRGYLINVTIIFMMQLTAWSEEPFWKESKLIPAYLPAVTWFSNFVEPHLTDLKAKMEDFNEQKGKTRVFQDNK
jgi:membrane protein required for colicin V production